MSDQNDAVARQPKLASLAVTALTVVLALGGGAWAWKESKKAQILENSLQAVQQQYEQTKSQLTQVQRDLADAQRELDDARTHLKTNEDQLVQAVKPDLPVS